MFNSAVCGAQDAALVTSTASDKTRNASWQAKSPNVAVVFYLPHLLGFITPSSYQRYLILFISYL